MKRIALIIVTIVVGCTQSTTIRQRAIETTASVDRSGIIGQSEIINSEHSGNRITENSITIGSVTKSKTEVIAEMKMSRLLKDKLQTPASWPSDAVWKPLRHFGRFIFHSPHLRVSGSNGKWFFNDFFTNNPDAIWFERYLKPLPVDDFETIHTRPPPPQYVPGEVPNESGLYDTLFALTEASYSSLFGGTVKLTFQSLENYEYDLRGEDIEVGELPGDKVIVETNLWDFSSVEIEIFVKPLAGAFNAPNAGGRVGNTVNVILKPKSPKAYVFQRTMAPYNGTEVSGTRKIFNCIESKEELSKKLSAALEIAAEKIGHSNPVAVGAAKFAHGLIHSQFQEEISTTHLVDMIEISDDYIDITSRAGIPKFFAQIRLTNIGSYTDSPTSFWPTMNEDEVSITVGLIHIFDHGGNNPVVTHHFDDVDADGGSISWKTYGAFFLDQCDQLGALLSTVDVREHDPFQDDVSETEFYLVPFDCDELEDHYARGDYGQVGGTDIQTRIRVISGWKVTGFDFESQIVLLLK